MANMRYKVLPAFVQCENGLLLNNNLQRVTMSSLNPATPHNTTVMANVKKARMRLFITIIIIFIFSYSKGQQISEDSLMKINLEAFNYANQEIPEYAAKSLSKIIDIDSSYYKVYYLRAKFYLRASEQEIFDSNDVVLQHYNDSSLIEKGVNDLKKCIQLYFLKPKSFPENLIDFDKEGEYKIIKKTSKDLGERSLNNQHQNLIDGVLVYMTSKGKNKKIACSCWKKAIEDKVFKAEILLNEFCKKKH